MKTKMKGVMVYVPEDQHRQMRSALALSGVSLSEWVRHSMAVYLDLRAKAKRGKQG